MNDPSIPKSAMDSPRPNLAMQLLSVRKLFRAHFQPTLREHGITEQQWRLLRQLHGKGAQSLMEIVEGCLILKPSMIAIIARTEEMGLVRREDASGARHRTQYLLTAEGETLYAKIRPILDEVHRYMDRIIGKSRLDRLYTSLDEVKERLERIQPDT